MDRWKRQNPVHLNLPRGDTGVDAVEHSLAPSNRVHGQEEDGSHEFSGLVPLTEDVDDLPGVEGDERVN